MEIYNVIFLLNNTRSRIVLLKRFASARFAPNRWTGIGGHVEKNENITDSVLRELLEETNIGQKDIQNFRQVADFTYKPGPYWPQGYRIVYFCAVYDKDKLPKCTEGILNWVSINTLSRYDIIDDTKAVLKLLRQKEFNLKHSEMLTGKFLVGKKGVTDHIVLE